MLRAGASGQDTSFNGMADEQAKTEQSTGPKKKTIEGPFAAMFKMFSEEDQDKMSDMNTVLRNMGAESLREVYLSEHPWFMLKDVTLLANQLMVLMQLSRPRLMPMLLLWLLAVIVAG
jgi:hypothetical protein